MGNRIRINNEEGTIETTRPLRESGGSIVLSIPPQLLDAVGLSEGDNVDLVAEMQGEEICFCLAAPDEADEDEE